MKTITFKSSTKSYWGKPLSELKTKDGTPHNITELEYSGSFQAYDNIDEVKAANDMPNDTEVVKFRNAQHKANERGKALLKAVTDAGLIQPSIENDDQLRLTKAFEVFYSNILSKATAEQRKDEAFVENARLRARSKASEQLEIEWADDDE